jgi:hypothetical protein
MEPLARAALKLLAQVGGGYANANGLLILILLWYLSMALAPLIGAYAGARAVAANSRRVAWILLGTVAGGLLSICFLGIVINVFDLPESRSGVGLVIAALFSPLVGGVLGYGITKLLKHSNGPLQ